MLVRGNLAQRFRDLERDNQEPNFAECVADLFAFPMKACGKSIVEQSGCPVTGLLTFLKGL